jgi:hypothetical protein
VFLTVLALPGAIQRVSAGGLVRGRGEASTLSRAELAVRAGDAAPVSGRVPGQFGCTVGITTSGGLLFCDAFGSTLYLNETGTTTILAHAGERMQGRTISRIDAAVPSPDGSVFLAGEILGGYASGLWRIPPGGGAPVPLLISGQDLAVPGGAVTFMGLIWPYGVAVDAAGRALVNVDLKYPGQALVRLPPAGPPEVLVRTGDPLGGGTVARLASAPGVSPSGLIAFAAELATGEQVVATLASGPPQVITESFPPSPAGEPGPLTYSTPVINDAGDVAFTLGWNAQEMEIREVLNGVERTLAAAGSPAPGGDTVGSVCCAPLSIDPAGGVLFGAWMQNGGTRLFRVTDSIEPVVGTGDDAGGGLTISAIHFGPSPEVGGDGAIVFAAWDMSGGYGIYSLSGTTLRRELSAGDPVEGKAYFTSLASSGLVGFGRNPGPTPRYPIIPFPYLGVGPSLSHGGRMIFDAFLSGGERGLFLREPDGALAAVAKGGDPAPGGGHYAGWYFSFHSINDAGMVAFICDVPDSPTGSGVSIVYGPAAGPLVRVIGSGDPAPGSGALVAGFLPPSRVNADGSLAIPLYLSDDTVVLFGWDGSSLFRVIGQGDVIPGAGAILSMDIGASGRLIPPLLDDEGQVVFEAVTASGGQAIYRAPLAAGVAASAVRLAGRGDAVEGGVLSSLVLEAMDSDAAGRLALQTPVPGGSGSPLEAVTYLQDPGAAARRVVGPGDTLAGVGTVTVAAPHMAFAGNGRLVHVVEGPWLVVSTAAATGGFQTDALAGPGMPAPDGGTYPAGSLVIPIFSTPPGPGQPPVLIGYTTRPLPDRVATDGDHLVAWHTATSASADAIILFDLSANQSPHADAGPPQTVECAGPSGAAVTLDGRASSDPDGDAMGYAWTGPFGTAIGAQPTVTLPLGRTTVTLTVQDALGASSSSTVDVVVQDTLPPALSITASPAAIWPPDGRMVDVTIGLTIQDVCDAAPAVVLSAIAITGRKSGVPETDIAGASIGSDDRSFQVRALPAGGRDGRTYTATYVVTDGSGNSSTANAGVTVSADRKRAHRTSRSR